MALDKRMFLATAMMYTYTVLLLGYASARTAATPCIAAATPGGCQGCSGVLLLREPPLVVGVAGAVDRERLLVQPAPKAGCIHRAHISVFYFCLSMLPF